MSLVKATTELLTNELLLADFPEIAFPVRHSEGNSIRALHQKFQNQPTNLRLNRKLIACASHATGDSGLTMEHDGQQVLIASHAIREGWSLDRTELEIRRRTGENRGPAIHSRGGESEHSLEAMQAACLMATGVDCESEHFRSRTARDMRLPDWLRSGDTDRRNRILEAADRQRGMPAVEMARHAINIDGGNAHNYGWDERMLQASFSGGSLGSIFTTSVNAQILLRYEAIPDTTRGWVRENTGLRNFKQNERHRLKKGGQLTKHARGGSAEHDDFSSDYETYRAHRYSRQVTIDQMDLIDDDLSDADALFQHAHRPPRRNPVASGDVGQCRRSNPGRPESGLQR